MIVEPGLARALGVFVPPIASVLVASGRDVESGWLEDEPGALLAALGLPANSLVTARAPA